MRRGLCEQGGRGGEGGEWCDGLLATAGGAVERVFPVHRQAGDDGGVAAAGRSVLGGCWLAPWTAPKRCRGQWLGRRTHQYEARRAGCLRTTRYWPPHITLAA